MIELRDYQEQLLADVAAEFENPNVRDVCAVLPTGGGKTVTFSAFTNRQTLPVAINVHRTELVSQISMTLASFEIRHRLIAPAGTIRSIRAQHHATFGRIFDNPQAMHSVSSVDTLLVRAGQYADYCRQVGYVLTDEAAHMLRENKWGVARELFTNARGIGFTATPKRADNKGLGRHADGLFDVMVQGPTTGQLIARGHLSDYKIIAKPSDINLEGVAIGSTGDYSAPQLRVRSHQSHIVGDVVETYIRFANGKQGITFTVDVETANELAAQFNAAGIPAASVSANTPEGERQDAVRRFRAGQLRQLTNCDLFGEGFDVPGVECVSLARPTMSLSLHLQQVGRALRPAPNKSHALIIDHVGNWERHGLPDSPRVWTLDAPERKGRQREDDAIPCTTCLSCFLVFERKLLPTCPHCGHTREPTARARPEQVDGDLTELDPAALAALRESVVLPLPEQQRDKVRFKTGNGAAAGAAYKQAQERLESQKALQDAIALWAGVRKSRGQSDAQSYREFFLAYGVDVLTAQTLKRAEMDTLRTRIERGT